MKDLYPGNRKTLTKEIEDDGKKEKDIRCSQMGRIHIFKVSTLPKAIYRCNAVPVNIPTAFATELDKQS